jgi:hypothetical protein
MTDDYVENSGDTDREMDCYLRWKNELELIGRDIGNLGAVTEQQFLKVGEKLSDLHARAERIRSECSTVAGGFSSEGTTDVIVSANKIIDRMGHYLQESGKEFGYGVEMLDEVWKTVPKIDKHLTGFKKMIKNLGILSISIKIESAQLKDGHDFVTIADDVEKLSVLINSRITDILARVRSLSTLTEHTMNTVWHLEGKQKDRTASIVENARHVISSVDQKNVSSAAAAAGISADVEMLARNMGEVVSSVQFHDITRQQIEHVKEALDTGAATLASARSGGSGSQNGSTMKNTVLGTRALCRLQKHQMEEATATFSTAVQTIVESLEAVVENTTSICDRVERLAGARGESSSTSLSTIEDDLSLVVDFLNEIKAGIRELSNAIESLSNTAGDMTTFVDDIEEIGSEIELIAVNARIKAAHTGEEGAPLGVIAEVIQRLSTEARTQKTAISGELRQIVTTVEQLRNEVDVDSDEQAAETDTLASDLAVLLEKLRAADDGTLRALASLQQDSRQLTREIEELAGGLTAHRDFSSSVERALSRLGSIVVESRELVAEDGQGEDLDTLKHLERNYTMRSERIVHNAHVRHDNVGDGSSLGAAMSASSNDHFSSNVELFS